MTYVVSSDISKALPPLYIETMKKRVLASWLSTPLSMIICQHYYDVDKIDMGVIVTSWTRLD